MSCRSSAAMCWRCCASRWRRTSYEYNLPRVIDLIALAALAIRAPGATGRSSVGLRMVLRRFYPLPSGWAPF
jgi:hypothetical protein